MFRLRGKDGTYKGCADDPVLEDNHVSFEELETYSRGDHDGSHSCDCDENGDDEARSILDGEVANVCLKFGEDCACERGCRRDGERRLTK
jgi:hypothetical protein